MASGRRRQSQKNDHGEFAKVIAAAGGALAVLLGGAVYFDQRHESNEARTPTNYSAPMQSVAHTNSYSAPVSPQRYNIDKIDKDAFLNYLNSKAADIDEFRRSTGGPVQVDKFPDGMEQYLSGCCSSIERQAMDVNDDGVNEFLIRATRRDSHRIDEIAEETHGTPPYRSIFDFDLGNTGFQMKYVASPEIVNGYHRLFAYMENDGRDGLSILNKIEMRNGKYEVVSRSSLPGQFNIDVATAIDILRRFSSRQNSVWENIKFNVGPVDTLKIYMAVNGQSQEGEDFFWSTISLARYSGVNPLEYKSNPEGFYNTLFDRVTQAQPATVASAVANRNVDKASYEIADYYSRTSDPASISNFLMQLQNQMGPLQAYQALALAQAGSTNGDLVPSDDVDFRKLALGIATKKGINTAALTPELVNQLYSEEVRSFSYGDMRLTAFGVAIDAFRKETGLTKRNELMDLNIKYGTGLGRNLDAYMRMHNNSRPPNGEIALMNSFGQAYAVPYDNTRDRDMRDPNVTHVPGMVEQYNNSSALQTAPRGQESNQRAQQDMQRAAEAAGRRAQEGINQAGQQLGNAINDLLNPKKKQ